MLPTGRFFQEFVFFMGLYLSEVKSVISYKYALEMKTFW